MKIIKKLLNLFKSKYPMAKLEKKHWKNYDEIMKEPYTKPSDMFGF
jgi:mRNA-degrading endonuclease HigB of HigAB toxin-antitoxin module